MIGMTIHDASAVLSGPISEILLNWNTVRGVVTRKTIHDSNRTSAQNGSSIEKRSLIAPEIIMPIVASTDSWNDIVVIQSGQKSAIKKMERNKFQRIYDGLPVE